MKSKARRSVRSSSPGDNQVSSRRSRRSPAGRYLLPPTLHIYYNKHGRHKSTLYGKVRYNCRSLFYIYILYPILVVLILILYHVSPSLPSLKSLKPLSSVMGWLQFQSPPTVPLHSRSSSHQGRRGRPPEDGSPKLNHFRSINNSEPDLIFLRSIPRQPVPRPLSPCSVPIHLEETVVVDQATPTDSLYGEEESEFKDDFAIVPAALSSPELQVPGASQLPAKRLPPLPDSPVNLSDCRSSLHSYESFHTGRSDCSISLLGFLSEEQAKAEAALPEQTATAPHPQWQGVTRGSIAAESRMIHAKSYDDIPNLFEVTASHPDFQIRVTNQASDARGVRVVSFSDEFPAQSYSRFSPLELLPDYLLGYKPLADRPTFVSPSSYFVNPPALRALSIGSPSLSTFGDGPSSVKQSSSSTTGAQRKSVPPTPSFTLKPKHRPVPSGRATSPKLKPFDTQKRKLPEGARSDGAPKISARLQGPRLTDITGKEPATDQRQEPEVAPKLPPRQLGTTSKDIIGKGPATEQRQGPDVGPKLPPRPLGTTSKDITRNGPARQGNASHKTTDNAAVNNPSQSKANGDPSTRSHPPTRYFPIKPTPVTTDSSTHYPSDLPQGTANRPGHRPPRPMTTLPPLPVRDPTLPPPPVPLPANYLPPTLGTIPELPEIPGPRSLSVSPKGARRRQAKLKVHKAVRTARRITLRRRVLAVLLGRDLAAPVAGTLRDIALKGVEGVEMKGVVGVGIGEGRP